MIFDFVTTGSSNSYETDFLMQSLILRLNKSNILLSNFEINSSHIVIVFHRNTNINQCGIDSHNTGRIQDVDSNEFGPMIQGVANPIVVTRTTAWPVSEYKHE